jgi:hypothetical protein
MSQWKNETTSRLPFSKNANLSARRSTRGATHIAGPTATASATDSIVIPT